MTKVIFKEIGTGEVKERTFHTQAGAAYWIGKHGKTLTAGIVGVQFMGQTNTQEVA
jgi:hypothetical protein